MKAEIRTCIIHKVYAEVVRGILNASHRNQNDFSLIVPAELLAEQKRTQRIFEMVMVAIASIRCLSAASAS
jgi:putative ABC transport system permease protein